MDRTWDVSPSGQLGRGVAATPYRFDRPRHLGVSLNSPGSPGFPPGQNIRDHPGATNPWTIVTEFVALGFSCARVLNIFLITPRRDPSASAAPWR